MSGPTEQRPRERRQRVLKRATIIIDIDHSETACSLRNQSSIGAELIVPLEAVLPGTFWVYVPVDKLAYRAEVRWRRGERMGVLFTEIGPKPKLHYG